METKDTQTPEVETSREFSDIISDASLIAALNERNIKKPTAVQSAAIPVAMTGKDIIVQAQTGSGKTLAFAIPIVSKLRATPTEMGTMALVVTPTRELAIQVRDVFASIAPEIKPACIIGGAKQTGQIKELREDNRIVIGTPGRLLDLIQQREIFLRKCRTFVLDEADEMLSLGFLEDIRALLAKLPPVRHGMFFSATITPRVEMLAQSFLKSPEQIVVHAPHKSAPAIEHLFCRVGSGVTTKATALCDLLARENPESAIIFCNTKSDTTLVEVYLKRRGFDAQKINSDLSQKERETIMSDFRSGNTRFLIATDVAARGIDIAELDYVINYSIHDQPETYVHRTGRTGRAGRAGKAISLVGPEDHSAFYQLSRRLSIPLKEFTLKPAEVAA